MFLDDEDKAEDAMDTLGGRIVSAREALSLSTAQLARRLGVNSATLRGWETDRDEPRSNRLTMLAGMLNVSPTWLLTGRGERPADVLNETELERLRGAVQQLRNDTLAIAEDLERLDERLSSFGSYRH